MAMVGRPERTERTMASCPLRNASYPKCCLNAPDSSISSSLPHAVAWNERNRIGRSARSLHRAVHSGLGKHQVIDDADGERVAGLVEQELQPLVFPGGRGVAGRMVVHE